MFKPSSIFFVLTVPRQVDPFLYLCCLCYTVLSIPFSLVVTFWEVTDHLDLLGVMFSLVLSLSICYLGSGVVLEFLLCDFGISWPRGYKKIMLNSPEHEIYPALKC